MYRSSSWNSLPLRANVLDAASDGQLQSLDKGQCIGILGSRRDAEFAAAQGSGCVYSVLSLLYSHAETVMLLSLKGGDATALLTYWLLIIDVDGSSELFWQKWVRISQGVADGGTASAMCPTATSKLKFPEVTVAQVLRAYECSVLCVKFCTAFAARYMLYFSYTGGVAAQHCPNQVCPHPLAHMTVHVSTHRWLGCS
jgi:hypothetical protein